MFTIYFLGFVFWLVHLHATAGSYSVAIGNGADARGAHCLCLGDGATCENNFGVDVRWTLTLTPEEYRQGSRALLRGIVAD